MRCLNCDGTEWENVDACRFKPSGMSICKSCGFVSYPGLWKSEAEIKKHYKVNYRTFPNAGNFYTGQRKVHFHNAFLQGVFKKWLDQKNESPVISEVGAAFGMALGFFKERFPKAEITGTEWTPSFRRVAHHEFGIELTEDFDFSKKYDLIMSYKVAEHQLDADQILRKYVECLKEDGVMYISVPTWFGAMSNFGLPGFDLEYYYDTNHVNVWTRKIFESVLNKTGLKIIKEDHVMYDSTYLCVRDDSLMSVPRFKESADDIKDRMARTKLATMAIIDGKIDEAIKHYPNFPQAQTSWVEQNRKQMFERGWEHIKKDVIDKAMRDCPDSIEVITMACDICMRAEKWTDAIHYAEIALKSRPENPQSLGQLMNIMREMALRGKDDEEKEHFFRQARDIAKHLRATSSQSQKESLDFIYFYGSQLPTPSEVLKLKGGQSEKVFNGQSPDLHSGGPHL